MNFFKSSTVLFLSLFFLAFLIPNAHAKHYKHHRSHSSFGLNFNIGPATSSYVAVAPAPAYVAYPTPIAVMPYAPVGAPIYYSNPYQQTTYVTQIVNPNPYPSQMIVQRSRPAPLYVAPQLSFSLWR